MFRINENLQRQVDVQRWFTLVERHANAISPDGSLSLLEDASATPSGDPPADHGGPFSSETRISNPPLSTTTAPSAAIEGLVVPSPSIGPADWHKPTTGSRAWWNLDDDAVQLIGAVQQLGELLLAESQEERRRLRERADSSEYLEGMKTASLPNCERTGPLFELALRYHFFRSLKKLVLGLGTASARAEMKNRRGILHQIIQTSSILLTNAIPGSILMTGLQSNYFLNDICSIDVAALAEGGEGDDDVVASYAAFLSGFAKLLAEQDAAFLGSWLCGVLLLQRDSLREGVVLLKT